jgi:hypothetical protein
MLIEIKMGNIKTKHTISYIKKPKTGIAKKAYKAFI